ncbi:MAG TPA: tetrapyrrole methylase, partial [Peptococcaceae bacterium]|nr:tetrapyrrole methylase [Peptococcaceae bacterium]
MEPKIIVAGLGPADLGQITLETWEALQTHRRIVLRTEVHPSVQALKARHIAFETCDAFYETCEDFQQVYEAIVAHLLEQTKAAGHEGEELLYCVPGHPMVAEETVQRLLQEAPRQGVQIEILSAMSFLDPVFTA